jgi:prevent-host-death family protein
MESWTVADAAAKLDDVIDHARRTGPQTITHEGRSVAVVVSVEERQQKANRIGSLADFFAASPLRDSRLIIERKS